MGFFSKVTSAVSSAVQTVAKPVTSVATQTRDFVATPTGSALLPMAAVFSPTGRANLAGFAQQAAPVVGGLVGGPAGAQSASTLANVGGRFFQPQQEAAGFFSSPTAPMYGGGGGGGYSPAPSYGGSGGLPSWVLPVGAVAVFGLVAILALKRK